MKKTIIIAILLLTITGCSSKKAYEYSGNCTICGKQTNWNSIGFCSKHYTLEKEQMLRGIKKNQMTLAYHQTKK